MTHPYHQNVCCEHCDDKDMLAMNEPIKRIEELQEEFSKVFKMVDDGIIPLLCATIIANQLELDPVWMFIVSPSAGGKTAMLESFEKVTLRGSPLCFPISDLTINTFASGQTKTGKETSLLFKMKPGSMMVFKDFTSMISKQDDAQKAIMSQLREIYDKRYVKRTGTGKDIIWQGKVGALAGCTEAIYESNEQFAVMGDRFVMYKMKQPSRMDGLVTLVKTMKDKTNKFEDKIDHIKNCVKSYIEYCIDNMENVDLELEPEMESELLKVVDFATMVSSGVIVDKRKNTVEFVPSHTMPFRMAKQLLAISQAFMVMNKVAPHDLGNTLTQAQCEIIYKIAFDTIPAKRRMAIQILAKFTKGASTAGIATMLGYQTPVVAGWLAQLNALGICEREKIVGVGTGDKWIMKQEYIDIMVKFEKIQVVDKALEDTDNMYDQSWGGRDEYLNEYLNDPKDDFELTEKDIEKREVRNSFEKF